LVSRIFAGHLLLLGRPAPTPPRTHRTRLTIGAPPTPVNLSVGAIHEPPPPFPCARARFSA
jgi:hypothetical protein